jgi:hypothetical protein
MVKQLGIFPISGTIGNVTFFKTARGGFNVRNKTSLTAAEFALKPGFDRFRKHSAEFIRATRAVKVLRSSIKELLFKTADGGAAQRLQKVLLACTRADSTSILGERLPQNGDLNLLLNFDFNNNAPLDAVMAAPFTATIDRITGVHDLAVPAFNPAVALSIPANATHFKVFMGAAGIDFATAEVEGDTVESAFLPITNALTTPLALSATMTPNSTKHLLLLIGVRFYEQLNAVKEPIYSHNPLTIVAVDQS